MATSSQIIAARNDSDLLARIVALAEATGIDNAQGWAEANRGRIVTQTVGNTTIADVHAYAVATFEPTPRPGANEAAVTDAQIIAAINAVAAV